MITPEPQPLTPDELAMIEADPDMELSYGDKNTASPADAGDTVSVPEEQDDEGFPLAVGVDADRAERFAVFDLERGAYVGGTVRTRKPTDKMVADLDADRFEWRRV